MVNEYLELKARVADNEKTQLQERNTSQQEQSIGKETSNIRVQVDYLIPSMGKSIIVCVTDCVIQLTDNLECLSDVQAAEKKLPDDIEYRPISVNGCAEELLLSLSVVLYISRPQRTNPPLPPPPSPATSN